MTTTRITPEAITLAIKEFHLPAMQSIFGPGFDFVLYDGKEWTAERFLDFGAPISYRWRFRCVFKDEIEYGAISFTVVYLENIEDNRFLEHLRYEIDRVIHQWVDHRMKKVRSP